MGFTEDDIDSSERVSIATNSRRCFASSSTAPHAPLNSLLADIQKMQTRLERLDEQGRDLDSGSMATLVGEWAGQVCLVTHDLEAAETQRCADVFKSIHWYNENLVASKKDVAYYKKAKTGLDKQWQANMAEREKVWEAKMQMQKQDYEAQLTEGSESQLQPTNEHDNRSRSITLVEPHPVLRPVHHHDKDTLLQGQATHVQESSQKTPVN